MPKPELYERIVATHGMSRRAFVIGAMSLTAAALSARRAWGAVSRLSVFSGYPFQLGIASGDPTPDGVVLWTRLAPQPLEPDGGMPAEPVAVTWRIAEDEQFARVVQTGTAVATPDWAHSVHVEIVGLQPDRWYWYQFSAGSDASPIGRTRTMPLATTNPERLRFAFVSCQHFEEGFYTAYDHLAREDLDLVVHLGDYIYESPGDHEFRVRLHETPARPTTLAEYRRRYGLYKSDPALQRAHEIAPWIVTWDDHEVENNYAGVHSQFEARGVTPEKFLLQRAAAYRAYYEHMPVRQSALPRGPDAQLYRRLAFGGLANFHVLDTRQYRSDQAYGDGRKPPGPELLDPARTMLGPAQREWLVNGLTRSPAIWNILAQQIMMTRVDYKPGPEVTLTMDTWAGYEAERRWLLRQLRERQITNPVVLTGDDHRNWANELALDFDGGAPQVVAPEFVGTSISSAGDGYKQHDYPPEFLAENPAVKFYNHERGFVRCEVTPKSWRADYRTVASVLRRNASIVTRASFVVEAGRPQLQRV